MNAHSASAYWQEHRKEVLDEQRARATVTCPTRGCDALVVRIERYHVNVEWELEPGPDGTGGIPSVQWTLGTHDTGTHFHLFCEADHECKVWGRQLPKRLAQVVYPGQSS